MKPVIIRAINFKFESVSVTKLPKKIDDKAKKLFGVTCSKKKDR